jgi:Oxidoreductase family, NAD-binding Rossmann fold/Oxidoreductase family, C-terminal alpha/beta domain
MKKAHLLARDSNRTNIRQLISRRTFLGRSLAAAGALAIPDLIPASARGADSSVAPSNRLTVALIGRGAMGSGHLHRLAYDKNFHLLAVCDVDRTRRETAQTNVNEIYTSTQPDGGYKGCAACNDYREILARADIDAVLIATPDHWHARQSIDAAKAGKDIYCEKPVSVTILEGRQIVQAVRRYGRVFQTGTQYRSIPAVRKVCQFIRDGRLGKIKSVFTNLHPLSNWLRAERFKTYAKVLDLENCGRSYVPMDFALPGEAVPEGLDWNLWVGPAPWRPFNHLYHVNPSPGVVPWSFCDAFGVTSSTWFLSHAADVIQWALGYENSGPVEVIHPDTKEFPTITCRYANGTLLHFVDDWRQVKDLYHAVPSSARLAGMFGGLFVGERGWLTTMSGGGQLEGDPESLFDEMDLKRTPEVNIGSNDHHANWLKCVRERKAPSADEEIGHRGAAIGHLLNICFWTGQSLKWDPAKELFISNDAANRLLSRAQRVWAM